ncbi:hypothetical protein NRB_28470 [Novosphingobium sp. 11B]
MSIALLSKPEAVQAAISEYDELGRAAFLDKYGFRPARSYFLEHDGRLYDSKAIVGVAVGKEHPRRGALRSDEFSGGEATVRAKLESLGFKLVIPDREVSRISSADVELLRQARLSGQLYSALSSDEKSAYERIHVALGQLGQGVADKLGAGYTLKLTSSYTIQSGVRGAQPKDLWFGIYPTENSDAFVGNPQLFLIVSVRGLEFGFAASTHPGDFSNTDIRQKVRAAAPKIFALLPEPGDSQADSLQAALADHDWKFRRKERLDPNHSEFPSLAAWLAFMHSEKGKREAGGNISRYVVGGDIDTIALETELLNMVDVFRPLMERMRPGRTLMMSPPAEPTSRVATALHSALVEFEKVRGGPFGRMEPMWSLLSEVIQSLEALKPIQLRPHIAVSASLGQGNWARVPWIALLNRNLTTTTEKGVYCVFLISKDLSRVYLTLNQGVTEVIDELGSREGAVALVGRALSYRSRVAELAEQGFVLENTIDLATDGRLPGNYKQGTIAYAELRADRLPTDETLEALLEPLLAAYDRLATEDAVEHVLEPIEPPVSEEQLSVFTIDDAMDGLFLDRDEFERILSAWQLKKNLVLQGAPGVGKSFVARRLAYALLAAKDPKRVETIQFHQSYSYEDFIQGFRPDGSGGFARHDGVFYRFCRQALKHPERDYVFIIDEINRGNISKILGELMLLIEHDKRDPEWGVKLAYSEEGEPRFHIPENLYIIGMMNTADRSLSVVDYALRRRFAFVTLDPQFNTPGFRTHLAARSIPSIIVEQVVQRMGALNEAILADHASLGRGYQIGHSFFVPPKAFGEPETWFHRVIETEIRPLLEEYWFDDPARAEHWCAILRDGAA